MDGMAFNWRPFPCRLIKEMNYATATNKAWISFDTGGLLYTLLDLLWCGHSHWIMAFLSGMAVRNWIKQ